MNEHNFNKSVSDLFDDSSFFHNLNDSLSRSCYQESSLSNLNVSALCCNNEHLGFDKNTGSTWIYPTNFPVRDYQYNIIQAALLKNTLVSLPTGLGKTFIAAVIMYNFYRWYPLGKIIFTAPTRPLVAQQIEACYNIIAIPSEDTVEMTGSMQVNTRKLNWKQKRVIFATPQVIYNDLKTGVCPHNLIRCLVFDEAHRARGNYAYCQIISTLTDMGHSLYRVVALSATPGSKVEDVIKVVKSLQISHLELRTESCIDVAPYSHSKKINTVVIQLGDELTHWRQLYVDILDVYARRLKQLNVLPNNIGNLSKGRIVLLYKEYQTKERNTRHPQHNYIVQDLSLLIALFHGLELLVKHGTRVFLNFFDEHPEKSWIQADDKLTSLLERLRDHLGVNPKEVDTSVLPDGTIGEVPPNISFGHPKFEKLRGIIMEHFTQAQARQDETKAIVFCEFRESVNLVNCLLLQCRPLIKPQMFVGQGATGSKATVSQKQQLHIMRSFREGGCNTLVATCVAEEGLDVGNVDIIICFDISTRSPVRLVQRCGRTGRKRGGQVYILVTEGREHQTLVECMHSRDTLNKRIMQSREVHKCLYEKNQRMLPPDVTPKCHKMHITVPSKVETKKKVRDIRDMITSRPSTSGTSSVRQSECSSDVLSKEEYESLFPNGFQVEIQFNDGEQLWNCSKEFLLNEEIKHVYASNNINLSSWIEWQRRLQDTVNVSHSTDSRILTELLQYADAKRFQLPSTTEIPEIGTQLFNTQSLTVQKEQKKKPAPKKKSRQSQTKNYGDIRALFNSGVKSTKEYTKVVYELGLMRDNTLPTSLIDIMVDLTINDPIKTDRRCLTCDIIGSNCDKYFKKKPTETLKFDSDLALPDVELISNLRDFTLDKSPSNSNTLLDDYIIEDKVFPIIDTNIPNSVIKSQECDVTVTNDVENNFNLEFDFDEDDVIEKSQNNDKTVCTQINFDLGDIDEIFNETQLSNKVQDNDNGNTSNPKETLEFFGLDSIEDIFADSSKEKTPQEEEILFPNSKGIVDDNRQVESKSDTVNRPFSPSLLSSFHTDDDIICSPILCSQKKSHARMNFSTPNNRNQIRKPIAGRISDLFHEIDLTNDLDQDSNRKANDTVEQSAFTKIENKEDVSTNKTTDMSMFTITQIVDIINKSSKPNTSSKNGDSADEIIFDNFVCSNADEISSSPILMTPTEKKKIEDKNNSKVGISSSNKSLIILSSSDESNDETIINDDISNNVVFGKRKLDEDDSSLSSPYFAKKPKLFFKCTGNTSQSIKDKLKLALRKSVKSSQQTNIINTSQKENISHAVTNFDSDDDFNDVFDTPIKKSQSIKSLDILKKFKRDRKDSILISTQNNITHNTNSHNDNSEDEFVIKSPIKCMRDNTLNKSFDLNPTQTSTVNHKVRKKARVTKQCEFIDYEAEDSDSDGHDNTWCTQDSELAGSIVDFICDDDDINNEDIYVHYLQSVKDQPRGMFKIPDLPKKSVNVLSQQLLSDDEQDYEMDSFCVDSNIGLTQVDDLSELEIAERILKDKRKKKLRNNRVKDSNDTSDSFNVISKKKNVRRISSDSDD